MVNNKLKKLKDGRLEFEFLSQEEEFRTRKKEVIGISYSRNYAVINSKEEALDHLETELKYVAGELEPLLKKRNSLSFDTEKFQVLCEAIIKGNGKTTAAKYKQLNSLIGIYQDIETLDKNIAFLENQNMKLNEQLKLVKDLK